MSWPLIYRAIISRYIAVLLPVSAVVGYLGCKIEGLLSDRYTPTMESVKEKREKRLLAEEKDAGSIKDRAFVPETIFERNLSDSLKKPDKRLERLKEDGRT